MTHRILLADLAAPAPGEMIRIEGPEAHHARVKRLARGDAVELLNGEGLVVRGEVAGEPARGRAEPLLELAVHEAAHHPPPSPRVEVCAAPPKGARLETMVDMLSQVGAARFCPLTTARSVVEPGEGKLERLTRIAVESAKQCGRAWLLEITRPMDFEEALSAEDARLLIADVSGDALGESAGAFAGAGRPLRVLVGPEGGWTEEELGRARAAGASVVRLGPYTMRIATAAIVAAGLLTASGSPRP